MTGKSLKDKNENTLLNFLQVFCLFNQPLNMFLIY